jgi:hypothetical protein
MLPLPFDQQNEILPEDVNEIRFHVVFDAPVYYLRMADRQDRGFIPASLTGKHFPGNREVTRF